MNDLSRTSVAALVSGGLYVAGSWLAPLAAPFLLLAPLPGLVVAARRAFYFCLLWCALVGILLSWAIGPDGAAGFVIALGLPAIAMGFGLRNWWSFERTAIAGVLCWTAAIVLVSLLSFGDFTAVIESAREQFAQGLDLVLATSGSLASSETAISLGDAERQALVSSLIEMLPALIVLTGSFMVLTNLVVVRNLTGVCSDVDLRTWSAPEPLIWILIASGFGILAPSYSVAVVCRNTFAVLLGCYFCQGLAVVGFYLEKYRLPPSLQVASYLLIVLQHILAAAVLAVGVFDLWGNFRRIGVVSPDESFDPDGD